MKNDYYKKDFGKLVVTFNGSDDVTEFYSQAGQDVFVLTVLNGKKNGKFLDIGASDPKVINNTYMLEKQFGWSGTQIEIDKTLADKCKSERSSNVICDDATKVDYVKVFQELGEVDYMSLDIDGIPTLEVLKKLPFDSFNIKVITFEHDSYRVGNFIRDESRKIFDSFGYVRICGDVANENNIYEDWYINKNFIDIESIKPLMSERKNWDDVLFVK